MQAGAQALTNCSADCGANLQVCVRIRVRVALPDSLRALGCCEKVEGGQPSGLRPEMASIHLATWKKLRVELP